MFSRRPSGSKIALAWLLARLQFGGFQLFDTQFLTDHLVTMGAVEIPRHSYQTRLRRAIKIKADITAMPQAMQPNTLF